MPDTTIHPPLETPALRVDAAHPDVSVLRGHLKMGGANPAGIRIDANSRYLTFDGRPWQPVMAEFHFSRYPRAGWREELLKMKAGGIHIVASYVFWIHHEEIEGRFDWAGNRDLGHFVDLCAGAGLLAYPRIGPWAHGECRNGGFPDWLLQRCGREVRRDAPVYLSYVQRLYQQIARQLDGRLWKDGGPVIGIQLENELVDGAGHIRSLKALAREAGLDVPLYTMTGWGPARVPEDEVIPVFGGYPDAFWDRQVDGWSRPSRKAYHFSPLRDDNAIGADLLKAQHIGDLSYLDRYPYGTCETGGGMQVAYHRRPAVSADDVAAIAYAKVGSGSNLLGYYMYHGGSHPAGRLTTMQESQATGYPNDLPVITYDFQAPLGEYGQVRPSYHALRTLHLFLADFGAALAPMPMTRPSRVPSGLDDLETVRWAVRSDGQRGFLFLNNHQRIESLPDHDGVQFSVALTGETLTLPSQPVRIPSGLYAIWPLNFDLGGMRLRHATAQPVCRLDDTAGGPTYVFAAARGVAPEFALDAAGVERVEGAARVSRSGDVVLIDGLEPGAGCLIRLFVPGGGRVTLLVLSADQARQAWKATLWGRERVVLSDDSLVFEAGAMQVRSRQPRVTFAVYPAPEHLLHASGAMLDGAPDGAFARYTRAMPGRPAATLAAWKIRDAASAGPVRIGPAGVAQPPDDAAWETAETWQATVPGDLLDGAREVFVRIAYAGDAGRAFLGDQLIADDFYFGRDWEIGLARFAPQVFQHGLTLKFMPLRRDAPVYIPADRWPDFGGALEIARVQSISVEIEQALTVTCPNE